MNERRMQFAIGLVTLLAGFALTAIIVWFGEFQFALQPRKTYYVLLQNAPGAEQKMPVRRAGIRIGEVTNVEYDDANSVVAVTIQLEGSNELRVGDEPTLKRGLFGDSYLDIETRFDQRGRANRQPYPTGTTLEGRSPLDTSATFQQATEIIPSATSTLAQLQAASERWAKVGETTNKMLEANDKQIAAILEETRTAMERLSNTLESFNKVLDPATQENIRVTAQNLRKNTDNLQPTVDQARKTMEQISSTVAKLDEIGTNLQQATKPLAERTPKTLDNIDKAAENLALMLEDFRGLTQDFRKKDGTIQRLLSDPSLYQHVDDVAVAVLRQLSEVEKIMQDVRVFADKIARHPGSLGVQGVITKDNGLKEVDPDAVEPKRRAFPNGILRMGSNARNP